jgi:hypothetical protein
MENSKIFGFMIVALFILSIIYILLKNQYSKSQTTTTTTTKAVVVKQPVVVNGNPNYIGTPNYNPYKAQYYN